MRHPRGIDLSYPPVKNFHVDDGKFLRSLRELAQWEILGGQCTKCGHIGWLDKRAVMARIGNHFLVNVRQRLRCSRCDNRRTNDLLIGHMDRNA